MVMAVMKEEEKQEKMEMKRGEEEGMQKEKKV